MAKKKLDLKEVMLEKGERIGLVAAVLVMVVLVVVGTVSALSNDSPGTTTQYIESKSRAIEDKLASGDVPAAIKPEFPIFPPLDQERVKLQHYISDTDFFYDSGRLDGKRLNPKLLMVGEGRGELARVQARNYMFSVKGRDVFIYVLVPKDTKAAPPQMNPQMKAYLDRLKAYYGENLPPQVKQQLGGVPGMSGLVSTNPDGTPAREEYKIEPVPLDRIPAGAKLAERVQPYRMAVVTAAFPYNRQVGLYCQALGVTLADMERSPDLLPQFLPFNVRRRTLDPTGKVKEDWKDLNYEQDLGPVLQFAVGAEAEDPALKPLLFQNLHFPRPQLTSRTSYPPVRLKAIDETLAKLSARAGGEEMKVILSPLEQKLRGGLSIFDNPPEEQEKPRPVVNEPARGAKKELVVPAHCLVRFYDVTVQPGYTYEYQFQIRAKNPNEGKIDLVVYPDLASHKELVSQEWGPTEPIRVSVSQEEFIYGIDLDPKQWPTLIREHLAGQVAFMQVHKWIERTRVNPEQRNSEVAVGDWVIGDVPVRRGEYIGRMEQAEVPVWFETRERFELAKPPPPSRPANPLLRPPPPPKGIPVDFTTPEILVDWEGGSLIQQLRTGEKSYRDVKDDANAELLVLSPDGKLRVHNSRVDSKNKEREQRYAEWKKWIEEVRTNKAGGTPGKDTFDPFKRPK